MHAISEQQKEGTDFWHLFSCVCVLVFSFMKEGH